MSYKFVATKDIEGIRKVKWDARWHVLYKWGDRETYDRVYKREAMSVLKKLEKIYNTALSPVAKKMLKKH